MSSKLPFASIAVVSQKGGVWKSTISRMIAKEATDEDWSVHIADLDFQQQTTTKWVGRRMTAGLKPSVYSEMYESVEAALKRNARADYDLLIFDGPARASAATATMAEIVDLVIQPTSPSLDDLEPAVSLFHALAKAGVPKTKLVYALINTDTAAEEADARYYLTRSGYDCLPGSIPHRPAFRQALNAGRVLTEVGPASLRKKAQVMVKSISGRLQREMRNSEIAK